MGGYSDIYVACTEQRENHGTMILDGACYSVIIQFCRVILSRMMELSCSQSFKQRLPGVILTSLVFPPMLR